MILQVTAKKDMYKALKKTIENGTHLELDVANSVAITFTCSLNKFFKRNSFISAKNCNVFYQ